MFQSSRYEKTTKKLKPDDQGYSREKIMNTLDLNAYGVTEMNHQEMVETDGGWRILVVAAAFMATGGVAGFIDREMSAGFQSGFNEAREARCNC